MAAVAMIALVLASPAAARADEPEEVLAAGEAAGTARRPAHRRSTPRSSRRSRVVRGMLSDEARKQSAAALRDQVYRRARLYVIKHQVVDENARGNRQLQVMVTIDRANTRGVQSHGIDANPVTPPVTSGGDQPSSSCCWLRRAPAGRPNHVRRPAAMAARSAQLVAHCSQGSTSLAQPCAGAPVGPGESPGTACSATTRSRWRARSARGGAVVGVRTEPGHACAAPV